MKDDVEVRLSPFAAVMWVIIITLFGSSVYLYKTTAEDRRQSQVTFDEFYVKHNCKGFGYVATKHDPVRTYQCDNGIFIARDMK